MCTSCLTMASCKAAALLWCAESHLARRSWTTEQRKADRPPPGTSLRDRLVSKTFRNCIFPRREAPRTMWLRNSSPIFRGPTPAIICSFRHGRTEASRYSTRERNQSSTAHLRTDPRLRPDPESAPYSLVEKHSQQCPPKEIPRQR